jgi:hypothetical protein
VETENTDVKTPLLHLLDQQKKKQKHEQQVITFGLDPFRTAAINPKEDTQPGEAQDKNASTEKIKKGSTPPPNVGAQAPPPSSSKVETRNLKP